VMITHDATSYLACQMSWVHLCSSNLVVHMGRCVCLRWLRHQNTRGLSCFEHLRHTSNSGILYVRNAQSSSYNGERERCRGSTMLL
jgi:hypothetical protein